MLQEVQVDISQQPKISLQTYLNRLLKIATINQSKKQAVQIQMVNYRRESKHKLVALKYQIKTVKIKKLVQVYLKIGQSITQYMNKLDLVNLGKYINVF